MWGQYDFWRFFHMSKQHHMFRTLCHFEERHDRLNYHRHRKACLAYSCSSNDYKGSSSKNLWWHKSIEPVLKAQRLTFQSKCASKLHFIVSINTQRMSYVSLKIFLENNYFDHNHNLPRLLLPYLWSRFL